jgi:hypothetical protein
VQYSSAFNTGVTLQVIEVVEKLIEVSVLSLAGTLDLMNLTTRSNKINLDPADLHLLPSTGVAPLMKKLPEKNQVRSLLHLKSV